MAATKDSVLVFNGYIYLEDFRLLSHLVTVLLHIPASRNNLESVFRVAGKVILSHIYAGGGKILISLQFVR